MSQPDGAAARVDVTLAVGGTLLPAAIEAGLARRVAAVLRSTAGTDPGVNERPHRDSDRWYLLGFHFTWDAWPDDGIEILEVAVAGVVDDLRAELGGGSDWRALDGSVGIQCLR
jgi:hypothetical protein